MPIATLVFVMAGDGARAAGPVDIGQCPLPFRQQLRAMARPEAVPNVQRTPEEERDFRLKLSNKFSQRSLDKGLWTCACSPVDISQIVHGEAWAMKTRGQLPRVKGSSVYSIMDSDICASAVHAGVLAAGTPGPVTFEKIDSPTVFQSTTQNGITSDADPKADPEGAFQFVGGALATLASADSLGSCEIPENIWLRLAQGKEWRCSCPRVNVENLGSSAAGSFVYSYSKSDICVAAVHAGALKPDTAGEVAFSVVDSPAMFRGTRRNGIRTWIDQRDSRGAFQFSGAPPPQVESTDLGLCLANNPINSPISKGSWTCACEKVSEAQVKARQRDVVGTAFYSMRKSDICWSAIHAGALKYDTEGVVSLEVIDAPGPYTASEQNGIMSKASSDMTGLAFKFGGR